MSTRPATNGRKLSVEDELRTRGVGGVLLQMAVDGQLVEFRCEMPSCYCPKGRGHFDPKSQPPSDWAPSADHYPKLKLHGGHLRPWNVRLAHVLCNGRDYGWRMKIMTMLKKGMSLEEIAENLNRRRIPPKHGTSTWSATSVRKAYVS